MDLQKKIESQLNYKRSFKHIHYADKIMSSYNELMDTDPEKIIKWGWDERDNML